MKILKVWNFTLETAEILMYSHTRYYLLNDDKWIRGKKWQSIWQVNKWPQRELFMVQAV